MKFAIENGLLKSVVKLVEVLTTEIEWDVSEDNIEMKAVDPAHVSMVKIVLNKGAFISSELGTGKYGINIEKLNNIVKLASGDDKVEIEYDEARRTTKTTIGCMFQETPVIDPSKLVAPKVPTLSLPGKVKLKNNEIIQGLKLIEGVSDYIEVILNLDGLTLTARGDSEREKVEKHIPVNELVSMNCENEYKSLFGLDYFSNLIRAINPQTEIEISLGAEMPIEIRAVLGTDCPIQCLIAPRIEDK